MIYLNYGNQSRDRYCSYQVTYDNVLARSPTQKEHKLQKIVNKMDNEFTLLFP